MTVATENCNALPTGYQLEEYRILSIIGQGDFGITYLAQDTKKNYQVALKEYFPKNLAIRENSNNVVQPKIQQDEKNFIWGLERFFKEGQILTNFQHPNIVRVLRSFKVHNTAYIVMEYEQGQNLSNVLKEKGTISEAEIISILPPLLSGLHAIHEAGFLHQNIKPDSIYLRDKNHTPVLLDFGAARYAIGRLHRSVEPIVTAGYAPFEQYQIKGPQGPWTDIYALGAVLYRAVSGQTPIEVLKRIDAITRQKEEDPLSPAIQIGHHHYSENLLQGIDWALQIAEEDRPQTVQQWAKTLLPKSSKPLKFYHSIVSFDRPKKRRFNRWVFASVILTIMGFNVGYVFYTEQRIAHLQQQKIFLLKLLTVFKQNQIEFQK